MNEVWLELQNSASISNSKASPPLLQGWVNKRSAQGIVKKWKKRWLVLHSSFLYYYVSPEDTKAKCVIYLEGSSAVELEKTEAKKGPFSTNSLTAQPWCFVVTSNTGRVIYLAPETEALRAEWIEALKRARDREEICRSALQRTKDLELDIIGLREEMDIKEGKWISEKLQMQDVLNKALNGELAQQETREALSLIEHESRYGAKEGSTDESSFRGEGREQAVRMEVSNWEVKAKKLLSTSKPRRVTKEIGPTLASHMSSSVEVSDESEKSAAIQESLAITSAELEATAIQKLHANRFPEAEQLYLRALRARKAVEGHVRSETAGVCNSIGIMYASHNRYSEAETFFQTALDTYLNLPGEERGAIDVLNSWTGILQAQKKYNEAIGKCNKALELMRLFPNDLFNEKAIVLYNSARLHELIKNLSKAEQQYSESLMLFQMSTTSDSRDRADAAFRLGKLFKRRGEYKESHENLSLAVSIYNKVYGSDDKSCRIAKKQLNIVRKLLGG